MTKDEMTRRIEDEEDMETDQVEKQPPAKRAKTKPGDDAISKKEMSVKKGKPLKVDNARNEKIMTAEEKKLAVMMIPKKDKRLFDSINKKKKMEKRDVNRLVKKREDIIQSKRKSLKPGSR